MSKTKHTLKISMQDNMISLETLDETRISNNSHASFLIKFRPKEIAITKSAKKVLMSCSRVQCAVLLEFVTTNTMAWAGPALSIVVPVNQISVPEHIKNVIDRFDVVPNDDD